MDREINNRWTRSGCRPKVALVRPYVNRRRLYGWYSLLGSHEPPLGILYIASYLATHGIDATILDGEQLGSTRLIAMLTNLRPEIVGVSASTFSFGIAATLSARIRDILPNALIVMGGPHVSALPIDSLSRVPALDGCVVGEGEHTLLEIAKGTNPDAITGLVWRANAEDFRGGLARRPLADLDQIELDWSLLDGFPAAYRPGWQDRGMGQTASLVASRGCPFGCTFCAGSEVHGTVRRAHSPRYIVCTMARLHNSYGIRSVYFHDDNFAQSRAWLHEFCTTLRGSGLPIRWSCACRAESLDVDTLLLMRSAGCYQIGVGVESSSQEILDHMCKGTTVRAITEGIRRIHASGLMTKAYLIIGTPTERIRDMKKTLAFAVKSGVAHIQVSYFTPLPGSPAFKERWASEAEWSKMNLLSPSRTSRFPRSFLRCMELGFYAACYGRRMITGSGHTAVQHNHAGNG